MRLGRIALVLVLLTGFCGTAHARWRHPQHVRDEGKVKLRHLAGTVVDSRGFALAYAAVELHDGKDHRALATTFADAKGKFFFRDLKRGEQLEIRASLKGFNPVQYIVVMSLVGKARLKMVLAAAV